ncbi:hypothetical protein GGQ77_001923 [Geobacillus thermodenitrificans]|uniref:hypothetical protein n=1 Tax=Geobacillus thermodenitrificans TaxID=33940 RepID=UPI002DF7DE93|nr:hypothetical protein [Geobacillus thermodenitrificans]
MCCCEGDLRDFGDVPGHGNEFGGVPHDMSRSAATGSRAVRRLAAKREWGRGT